MAIYNYVCNQCLWQYTAGMNSFRYLKLMFPLNAAICATTYLERQKNNYLTLRSMSNECHYSMWHTTLWTCTHIPNKYYLKTIIWPWGQRLRFHKGHYGMRHTALWSCIHIPNIIDLYRKTNILWPGQENTI